MADLAVVSKTGHEVPVCWDRLLCFPKLRLSIPPAFQMLTERGEKPRYGEASGRLWGEPGLNLCSSSFPSGSSSVRWDLANPASGVGGSLENMLKVVS